MIRFVSQIITNYDYLAIRAFLSPFVRKFTNFIFCRYLSNEASVRHNYFTKFIFFTVEKVLRYKT